jgi:hypothetical protein
MAEAQQTIRGGVITLKISPWALFAVFKNGCLL